MSHINNDTTEVARTFCMYKTLVFLCISSSTTIVYQQGCNWINVRKRLKCYIATSMCCLILPILIISLALGLHYRYNLVDGDALIGNLDVILLSKSKYLAYIELSTTEYETNVTLYHEQCSEIEQVREVYNSTIELTVYENLTYPIEELYLVRNSQAVYNFTVVDVQAISSCVADVHVFLNYSDYIEFLSLGRARNPSKSYCLSPNEPLVFQLNSFDRDSYYFVGLKSLNSTTLNYTTFKDLLEYNITSANNVSCALSLLPSVCFQHRYPEGQEVCVLASLPHSNTFINVSYSVVSYVSSLIWGLFFFSVISLCLIMTFLASQFLLKSYFYYCQCEYRETTCICFKIEYLGQCQCCNHLVTCCNHINLCCQRKCRKCHACDAFCYDHCISKCCY